MDNGNVPALDLEYTNVIHGNGFIWKGEEQEVPTIKRRFHTSTMQAEGRREGKERRNKLTGTSKFKALIIRQSEGTPLISLTSVPPQ